MSKPVTVKSQFFKPPIDGLNLISDPGSFQETEARQLDNYYIYDWGIRERGPFTTTALPDGGYPTVMYSFTSAALQGTLIGTSKGHIYRWTGSFSADYTSLGANSELTCAVGFNKKIIIPYFQTDTWISVSYDITNDSVGSGYSFVGVPLTGCAYKDRTYWAIGSKLYYSDVAATTGLLGNSFDFGQIFQNGKTIIFACSWSYNQGLSNEELLVVGNDAGEVLIYSGDWPAATNWQLVTRVRIPNPIGRIANSTLVVTKAIPLGQDILITTTRGVISLAAVVNGRAEDAVYYSVSRKIGPVLTGTVNDRSTMYPFAYFGGTPDLYVLNYERGAWSKFPNVTSGGDYITCINCASQPPAQGTPSATDAYVLIGIHSGGFIRVNESAVLGDSTATYTFKSQFYDLDGKGLQSQVTHVQPLGRDIASASLTSTVKLSTEYDDSKVGIMSTQTTTVTDQKYVLQDLAPSDPLGSVKSLWFEKTGSASACNELAGYRVTWQTGGTL